MSATDDARRIAYARRLARTGAARAMREDAGLSLRELARGLDMATSTVHRWEMGANRPRGNAALRWLAMLEELAR